MFKQNKQANDRQKTTHKGYKLIDQTHKLEDCNIKNHECTLHISNTYDTTSCINENTIKHFYQTINVTDLYILNNFINISDNDLPQNITNITISDSNKQTYLMRELHCTIMEPIVASVGCSVLLLFCASCFVDCFSREKATDTSDLQFRAFFFLFLQQRD